jgi:hypothetical protein
MQGIDIEGLAERVVRTLRLRSDAPVDAMCLARKLLVAVRQMPGLGLPGDAVLARVNGQRRIYVREGLPPRRLRWAVLHECAEAVLIEEGYRGADAEIVADRLAASLGVPRPAAVSACRERGARWRQLAFDFGTSQSCAALRFGEVTGQPILLVTDRLLRTRGEPAPWPSVEELRAPQMSPGIRKSWLSDAIRRVVARRVA